MTRADEARQHIEDPAAYEHSDLSARGLLYFIGGLLVAILLTLVVIGWIYRLMTATMRKPELAGVAIKTNQIPPPPRLEVLPGVEMRALRAREDAILRSYGWVNAQEKVARIPIERAMDLIAQRGLPARVGQGPVPSVPATGPQSGGPQTGQPVMRGATGQKPEASQPLRGAPRRVPGEETGLPGPEPGTVPGGTRPAPRQTKPAGK